MVIEWSGVLSRPEVLSVLRRMLAEGANTIEPTVDDKGGIVYSTHNGESEVVETEVLESMVETGIFERKSEGRVLACPQHEGAIDLMPRLKCPHCGSLQLTKGSILQHTCGFTGAPNVFAGVCPHCKKPSPPQTLKAVGTWYECESCGKRSAQPNVFLICRRFNHDFAIGLAKLLDQARYILTAEAAMALKGRLGMIIAVLDGLRAAGVVVEPSGKMTGASGVQHEFDLLVDSGTGKAPIDVKVGDPGPVDVVGVLSTYAKALDTKATPTILVAVPNATEDAKKTAGAYGMVLIEGNEPSAITSRILKAIGSLPAAGPGPSARVGAEGVSL